MTSVEIGLFIGLLFSFLATYRAAESVDRKTMQIRALEFRIANLEVSVLGRDAARAAAEGQKSYER